MRVTSSLFGVSPDLLLMTSTSAAGSLVNMVDCSNTRCIQERRLFKKELLTWSKKVPLIVGEYDYYTIPEVCGKSEHFPRPGSLIFTDGIVVQFLFPSAVMSIALTPARPSPSNPVNISWTIEHSRENKGTFPSSIHL